MINFPSDVDKIKTLTRQLQPDTSFFNDRSHTIFHRKLQFVIENMKNIAQKNQRKSTRRITQREREWWNNKTYFNDFFHNRKKNGEIKRRWKMHKCTNYDVWGKQNAKYSNTRIDRATISMLSLPRFFTKHKKLPREKKVV